MEFNLKTISKESFGVIGTELKRRRISSSKTLDSSTCECSISYISKIENGKIIPKMHILQELCEERGITEEDLYILLSIDDTLKKAIECLFWNNYDEILKIYDSISSFDNYKVNFLKVIYEIIFMHWNKVDELMGSLYVVEANFDNFEHELYYYLKMVIANKKYDYPEVFKMYPYLKECKNNHLSALALKELFIAVCSFGFENPLYIYDELVKKYASLLNYSVTDLYGLLLETLIKMNYDIPKTTLANLKPKMLLEYYLVKKDITAIDNLLEKYKPSTYEKILIYTVKKDYVNVEKTSKKLQLHKLSAKEIIIANYCLLLSNGSCEEIADYISNVGIEYAKKINDGALYELFIQSLADLSIHVGKYKSVVIKYLEFLNKARMCRVCLL